jgi:dienelactone hydrolase
VPHGAIERAAERSVGADVDSAGWSYWPDNEDLSNEFARLLGAAQEGGSTISECFLTASRIDPQDEDSWYQEWKRTADANHERGNTALSRGHVLTAQSNWLRAINYYQAAAYPFDAADNRQQAALLRSRSCAHHYLEHLTPAGEVVDIPWLDDYSLQGYFLPAPSRAGPAPVVVCLGEPGSRKEELLYKLARYARDRGMSMLAVDLCGSGTGAKFEKVAGRSDLETAIGHVVDYLLTRDDVDQRRIAIFGDGSGSSFVARGAALDRRLAAAVCDGGIWDLHERAFLMRRVASLDCGLAAMSRRSSIARYIKCPVLVTLGEHGWLEKDQVTLLFEQIKASHRDIELKIFRGSETAAAQGHADNPTLANEYIFDWISDRLAIPAKQSLRRRALA